MEFAKHRNATEINGENAIESRCLELHKRNDVKPYIVIGVENSQGEIRLRITCHTQAEEAGITRFLEDRNFKNMTDLEEIDEETDTVYAGIYVKPPDGFELIYRQMA